MVVVKPEYCALGDCNRTADRAHLITRATLNKDIEWNPVFYIHLCREHHVLQHKMGIESFCSKYGFEEELQKARDALHP
jgi:hypothetical protein